MPNNLPAVRDDTQVLATKRPDPITATIAEVDEIGRIGSQIREFRKATCIFWSYDIGSEVEKHRHVIARARHWLDNNYADSTATLEAAAECASREYLMRELKLLIGSWPNVAKADLANFAAVLAAEVNAMKLTRFGISAGCRRLRLTCKFVPTIAEAVEAFKEENENIFSLQEWHRQLPTLVAETEDKVAEHEASEADLKADSARRAAAKEIDRLRRSEEGKATQR